MAQITTYATLKTEVGSFLHRNDLDATELDVCIGLAEADFNRVLRTRQMDTLTTLSLTTNTVALPADFVQMRNLEISASPIVPLKFVTPEQRDLYDRQVSTGQPRLYTIQGSNIITAPAPDQTYTLNLDYFAKIAGLTSGNTTNWLLTLAPNVYFAAVLAYAMTYVVSDDRADRFMALAQGLLEDLNRADDDAMYSGGTIRLRTDVAP